MSKTIGSNTALKIAVVIPTVYKADFSDVIAAVCSLNDTMQQQTKVHQLSFFIFVDKAATDFDGKKVRQYLHKNTGCTIKVGWSHTQIGFTGAVNQSVQLLTAAQKYDWLLIFNDDAVALRNFWGLSSKLSRQQVGVVSCGVADWNGKVESVGLEHGHWGLTLPIKQIDRGTITTKLFSGTCFFVSTATTELLFEEFGFFFFPLFFAYAEDFELSVRLGRLGLPVTIDQHVRVRHKGSQTSKRGSAFQLFYGLRNDFFVRALHQDYGIRFGWYVFRYLLYVVLLCTYKGYMLLLLRIFGSIWKQHRIIDFWRTQYDQQLPHSYTF